MNRKCLKSLDMFRRQLVVRILDGWPSAEALLGAYEKMAALC